MSPDNKNRSPRTDDPNSGKKAASEKEAPAGNAIYDPSQQSHRRDIPDSEQDASGEPARGTAPPGTRRVTTEPADEGARRPLKDEETAGR